MSEVLSAPMNMSLEAYVSGYRRQHPFTRPLFIKRPFLPTMSDIPITIAQTSIPYKQQQQYQPAKIIMDQDMLEVTLTHQYKTKSTEVQTDYRDTESQTIPYTPQHIMREGQVPQIYSLKQLKWGNGLPCSINQLEMIELRRQKLWFEYALPPISDQASFGLRRLLMEQQEMREWNKKQNEIRKFHNERLYLVQNGLIYRQKDIEEKNFQRNQEIKIKKTEIKNRLVAKIQRKKIKILRKLIKSRKSKDQQSKKRDIIEEYSNFASKVYAGITRQGLSLDKIANKYQIQPASLMTYVGIEQLSQKINPRQLQAKINLNKEKQKIYKDYTRLENSHKKYLEQAQRQLMRIKQPVKVMKKEQDDEFFKYKFIKARPPTPTFIYDENLRLQEIKKDSPFYALQDSNKFREKSVIWRLLDKRKSSIIFLQRIIRGRTQQNIMYQGKQKRLALIQELLTVAKTQIISQEEAEQRLLKEHQEKLKDGLTEGIQGEIIAKTLDGLSKQLLRMKQKRKITELRDQAEKDRLNRQIEEAGRRHAQQILRDREQFLYNEMMKMNQGTVDTYLDYLIKNTVDKGKLRQLASSRQAQIMAQLRKTEMNSHLETYQRRYNNNETLIRDLVQSFLLPNTQRSKVIKRIELQEHRFKQAAKKSLQMTMTRTATKLYQNQKKGQE